MTAYLFDHLWSHPEGRTNESAAFAGRVGELSSHAEVGQLHLARFGEQNVGS